MPRDLNKEAFLWHAMTSPEYLDRSFAKLSEAAEYLRQRIKEHEFINRYPPLPRWLQAMEALEESYGSARAMLVNGEYDQMRRWAGALKNIPRGFSESSMDWLPMDQQDQFKETLDRAYGIASSYMDATTMSGRHFRDIQSDWRLDHDAGFDGSSICFYWEDFKDHIWEIPEFRADTLLDCSTGELVPWTGVWIPVQGAGSAALAFARQGQIMQPAYEVFFEQTDPDFEQTRPIDVTWHPFRPTGRLLPVNGEATVDPLRVAASKSATQTGWWFTPARQGSRRHFKQGDVFPDVEGSSYGATFWLWSPDQSHPKL